MAKKVRKTKKTAKSRAAVKTGARGGKYRVVSGKKVYVKSRAKQTTRRVKAKVTRVRRARKPRAAPIGGAGADILPMPTAAATRIERADKPAKPRSGDHYEFYALHSSSGEFETVPFASKRLDAIFLGGGGQGYRDFLDAFRSPGGSSSDIVREVMSATYKKVVKRYPRFKDTDAYDLAGMRLSNAFAKKIRAENDVGWDSTDLEDFQNA